MSAGGSRKADLIRTVLAADIVNLEIKCQFSHREKNVGECVHQADSCLDDVKNSSAEKKKKFKTKSLQRNVLKSFY